MKWLSKILRVRRVVSFPALPLEISEADIAALRAEARKHVEGWFRQWTAERMRARPRARGRVSGKGLDNGDGIE